MSDPSKEWPLWEVFIRSKQGLELAALESVYAQLREKERALSLADREPAEAMAALVGFSFDYLSEHPEFISLLVDENRNGGQHIRESKVVQQMHLPLLELLEATGWDEASRRLASAA